MQYTQYRASARSITPFEASHNMNREIAAAGFTTLTMTVAAFRSGVKRMSFMS